MNTWQIGDVKVTRIVEMEVTGGSRFILPDATPEAVQSIEWLVPHFANPGRQTDYEHPCSDHRYWQPAHHRRYLPG